MYPFRDSSPTSPSLPQTSDPVDQSTVNLRFFDEDSEDEEQDCVYHDCSEPRPDTVLHPNPTTTADEHSSQDILPPAPLPQPRQSGRIKGPVKSTAASNGDCVSGSVELVSWELGEMFDCVPPQCNLVTSTSDVPRSFTKAVNGPEGDMWMKACRKEIQAMKDKKFWVLVDRPAS